MVHFLVSQKTGKKYLNHELLNHTMEDGALVVQRLARLAIALLASAETAEVLGSLGDEIRVEFHGDAASRLASQADVEEDTGACRLGVFRSHLFFLFLAYEFGR